MIQLLYQGIKLSYFGLIFTRVLNVLEMSISMVITNISTTSKRLKYFNILILFTAIAGFKNDNKDITDYKKNEILIHTNSHNYPCIHVVQYLFNCPNNPNS